MSTAIYDFDYYTLVSDSAFDGNTSSDILVGGFPSMRDFNGDAEFILLHFPIALTNQQIRVRSATLKFMWYSLQTTEYKTLFVRTCTANFDLADLSKINYASVQSHSTD